MAEQKVIRVAWLTGNRESRRKTVTKIKTLIGDHEEVHVGDGDSFDQLEALIIGGDCFGTKRLVVVDALPEHPGTRATYMSHMKKLMDRVPEDAFLLFNGLSDQALANHAKSMGKVFDAEEEVAFDRAVALVNDRLKAEEKSISVEDARQLVMLLRSKERNFEQLYDVDHISLVLDKLVAYADKRKHLTTEDVLMVVPNNTAATNWVLYDAIDNQDVEKALILFNKLWPAICASEGGAGNAAGLFLGGLISQYRLLLLLKEGKSPADAVNNAKMIVKLKQESSGLDMRFTADGPAYSDGRINKALGSYGPSPLTKYTMKRLVSFVEAIGAAIEQARYAETQTQYLFIIQSLLMLGCGKIDDSTHRKLSQYFDEHSEI